MEKLYELARQGIEIERKARLIEIKFIDIIEFDGVKEKLDVVFQKEHISVR